MKILMNVLLDTISWYNEVGEKVWKPEFEDRKTEYCMAESQGNYPIITKHKNFFVTITTSIIFLGITQVSST